MSPAYFWLDWLAVKSCCNRFGAMLNVWSLSVRRRENDPPDHFLTLLHLEFMGSDHTNRVLPHQTAHPAMSYTQAQLVQLFRHSGATITALAQSVLLADMRQKHHITPLSMRYRSMLPHPKATIRDPHHIASVRPGKPAAIVIQKRELHGFWAAKNCVAFFSSSLSSLRIRFSRRSRSFSRRRFWSRSGGPASSETIFTHLFRVEGQPPNQTQPDAVSGHWSSRCELHPA